VCVQVIEIMKVIEPELFPIYAVPILRLFQLMGFIQEPKALRAKQRWRPLGCGNPAASGSAEGRGLR
jgi:hypothetical protein